MTIKAKTEILPEAQKILWPLLAEVPGDFVLYGGTAPAPIFDNGISLFNYAMPEDMEDLGAYAKTRSPAYGGTTFERICSEVMGDTQLRQLEGLKGFKFIRHPSTNWPEARLIATEKGYEGKTRRENKI